MFKGKAIYNPSGKAGEYSYWASNFYLGCSNGCTYCFLKKGRSAKTFGGDKPTLKKCFKNETHALEVFEKELLKNLDEIKDSGMFFSFTTDPMINETVKLTVDALLVCQKHKVPVKILTKKTDYIRDLIMCADFHNWDKGLIAVGVTLTGHDELEPDASPNNDRLNSLYDLNHSGFKTFASIEPIIDFKSSKKMIEKCVGICDLVKVGLESGKKFHYNDAYAFMSFLVKLKAPKIYIKESLRKLVNYGDYLLNEIIIFLRRKNE